jgi:hypothetical protein
VAVNPYQSRRLANRLHIDRSRRIESLLIRLAAEGSLDVPEGTPDDGHYKVKARNYVWCDVHGAVHQKEADYYQDDPNCLPENWRPVFVQSDDPNEDF